MCRGCEPSFSAVEFAVLHEDGVLIGGFRGESSDGDDPYLLLQVADEFDDQDRRLGMDTYYVELSGQGASGYGGIEQIHVRHDCCHLLLSDAGREMLGTDAEVCILYSGATSQPIVASSLRRFVGLERVTVTAATE